MKNIKLPSGSDRNKVEFLTKLLVDFYNEKEKEKDELENQNQNVSNTFPYLGEYKFGAYDEISRNKGMGYTTNDNGRIYLNHFDVNGNNVSDMAKLLLKDSDRDIYLHIENENGYVSQFRCLGVYVESDRYNLQIAKEYRHKNLPQYNETVKVALTLGGDKISGLEGSYCHHITSAGTRELRTVNSRNVQGLFDIGFHTYVDPEDMHGDSLYYGQFTATDEDLKEGSEIYICAFDNSSRFMFSAMNAMEGDKFTLAVGWRDGSYCMLRDVEYLGFDLSTRKLSFKVFDYTGRKPSNERGIDEDDYWLEDIEPYSISLIPKSILSNQG